MEGKKCNKCGELNEQDSDFCGTCGTDIKVIPITNSSQTLPKGEPLGTLRPCPDCREMIFQNTQACPNCGRPFHGKPVSQKQTHPGVWLALIIIVLCVFAVIWCMIKYSDRIPASSGSPTIQSSQNAQTQSNACRGPFINIWNNSSPDLVKAVKKSMNDPKSFEHIYTRYWNLGNQVVVKMAFRGRNAFGGVVAQKVRAEFDCSGSLLSANLE